MLDYVFAYLSGKLTEKNIDKSCFVLELNGIGYLIHSNARFLNAFSLGDEARVYTSVISKEEKNYIYGFSDKASRDIFEILISVSGVGPKAALSILNILNIDQLIGAVLQEKPKLISEAQGIGLKTAQRIILELKNKLSKYNSAIEKTYNKDGLNYKCSDDIASILYNLGYSAIEVDQSLNRAKEEQIADDAELLVQYCLRDLASKASN